MTRFYREEDLFPREFTGATERPWGILFHNADNPDSYDSNHALIFRDRATDLPAVLSEIADFYLSRGIRPVIYQSIFDSGWFGEIAPALEKAGFRSWLEEQVYMALTGNIKAVTIFTAVFFFDADQFLAADGANQFHIYPSIFYHTLFSSPRQIKQKGCGLLCGEFLRDFSAP